MVDVSDKPVSARRAVAEATVKMDQETLTLVSIREISACTHLPEFSFVGEHSATKDVWQSGPPNQAKLSKKC
jgi:molybdenum cofactor biosynthesis enzyme